MFEKTFLDGRTSEDIGSDRRGKIAVSLLNRSIDAEPWQIISTACKDFWKHFLGLTAIDLPIMEFTSYLCQTPISMCVF